MNPAANWLQGEDGNSLRIKKCFLNELLSQTHELSAVSTSIALPQSIYNCTPHTSDPGNRIMNFMHFQGQMGNPPQQTMGWSDPNFAENLESHANSTPPRTINPLTLVESCVCVCVPCWEMRSHSVSTVTDSLLKRARGREPIRSALFPVWASESRIFLRSFFSLPIDSLTLWYPRTYAASLLPYFPSRHSPVGVSWKNFPQRELCYVSGMHRSVQNSTWLAGKYCSTKRQYCSGLSVSSLSAAKVPSMIAAQHYHDRQV